MQNGPAGAVSVGLDVGKEEIYAVMRLERRDVRTTVEGGTNPSEVPVLVAMLGKIGAKPFPDSGDGIDRDIRRCVAGQSCGSSRRGIASCERQSRLGLCGGVGRGPVATRREGCRRDRQKLAAYGKSSPWPYHEPNEEDAELAYWVDWLDPAATHPDDVDLSVGGGSWPGTGRKPRGWWNVTSMTLLRGLAHYGGPARLWRPIPRRSGVSRPGATGHPREKAEGVLAAAVRTEEAPAGDARQVADAAVCSMLALAARHETRKACTFGASAGAGPRHGDPAADEPEVVGLATACVLWVTLGDPRNYPSGGAYRKALGLNLKEQRAVSTKGGLKSASVVRGMRVTLGCSLQPCAWPRTPACESSSTRSQEGQGTTIMERRR